MAVNEELPVSDPGRRVRWGEFLGVTEIAAEVDKIYSQITTWQKNIFELPRNAAISKDMIAEATRLVTLFNNKSAMEQIAIPLLVIFLPLMLQKPSQNSKKADHTRNLKRRLNMWKKGELRELFSECAEIQKRLKKSKRKEENASRGFVRLMMEGRVRQALKLVNADTDICGVHEMSDNVRRILQEKHPAAEDPREEALDNSDIRRVENVIFEDINASLVQKSARSTAGSGGPTKIDAEVWKNILCSKSYGKYADDLAEEIAVFARRLCTENIPYANLEPYWACRLVPLMKEDDGVRPVGIGETLRRIVGKCVIKVLGEDVQIAAGSLQTCTGVAAGIEAAIHATARTFEEDSCEALLMVDADNAFNRLNRKVAMHNIQRSCPPLHQFLHNGYKEPAKLHLGDGTYILSEEGATQGCNLAMAKYALGTRNMIIESRQANQDVFQVWFADDSIGAGMLVDLKVWWDHLNRIGPAYGYFPKYSKTHLILKNPDMLERAKELFGDEANGVKFTVEGKRHLGAAIGSIDFKEKYVNEKVEKWVNDVTQLADIARDEPQVALSAYNTGLSQRWKFVQRTIPSIAELFEPLETAIRHELIPALCGREVSDTERRIFALPYRYGGLGILNPTQTAEREYRASKEITAPLTDLIYQQDMDLTHLNREAVSEKKAEMMKAKEEALKLEHESVMIELDIKAKRLLEAACEKGASSWLSALPLRRLGYIMNKQEFRDAIRLRYGWSIPGTPKHCACGQLNSVDHILICKKGGYVTMRHNVLRDTEAKLMEKVCKDVRTEPRLLPEMRNGNEEEDRKRPDISARGVWSPAEKTFFDILVTHPNADSYLHKSLDAIYHEKETQKKNKYNERVINVEKASFTPLVFTTTGGMSPECERLNKRLAEKIAAKQSEMYSQVMAHIRTRLRFALLKATLVAVRGIRGRVAPLVEDDIEEISFNLIPQERAYESY